MIARLIVATAVVTSSVSVPAFGAERVPFAQLGRTCADAAELAGERLTGLFNGLDLEREGLAPVRRAFASGDLAGSCDALLDYYAGLDGATVAARLPQQDEDGDATISIARAQALAGDEIEIHRRAAPIQRTADGYIDWQWRGPWDEEQWKQLLNRHMYLLDAVASYDATGATAPVAKAADVIRDWTWANWDFKEKNAQSAAYRLLSWPQIFYGLRAEPAFDRFARIILLASVPRQVDYVLANHDSYHNHGLVEMSAVALTGPAWPEFKQADDWFATGVSGIKRMLEDQVYPDGIYKELSNQYQMEVFGYLEEVRAVAAQYDPSHEVAFMDVMAAMADYMAYSVSPLGWHSQNNDSSRRPYRAELVELAEAFERPDWAYVATAGAVGDRPSGAPSRIWPWGGHVALRSGWDADALWAFFDVGPWGREHMHDDRLHLSLVAYGREFLTDAGTYNYEAGDPWRAHFIGSSAHNVVLVDGQVQGPQPRESWLPIRNGLEQSGDLVLARGAFTEGFRDLPGRATHSRAVAMVDDRFLVVVDRIETDRPRRVTALWHFAPDVSVETAGAGVTSVDRGSANLRIEPVSGLDWQADIVRGQTEPEIQGWYSELYNVKVPTSVARFTAEIDGSATFAWILLPDRGAVPSVQARWRPTGDAGADLEIAIGDAPPERVLIAPTDATRVALDDGRRFEGWAAYLPSAREPSVIGGTLRAADGTIVARHDAEIEPYKIEWLAEHYYRTARASARDLLRGLGL